MKKFSTFLNEAVASISNNAGNTNMGSVYEMGTVLHVHDNSAARQNKDKVYQKKITDMRKQYQGAITSFSPEKQADIKKKSQDSGISYLKSLATHENIEPEHIHEVHHTHLGISEHLGRDVVRADNPHDLIVKGKKGRSKFIHGASLKATSGTASNNPIASFERQSATHGMVVGTTKTWTSGKKKVGLDNMTNAQIKERRDEPKVVAENQATQQKAAKLHAKAFNNATHEQRQQHILHFLKAHPDMPYHYVVGEKGGKSIPINKHPAVAAINNAENITATVSNNVVKFHDEQGNHIASAEHRPTHGSFYSPQTNFKFGSVKASSND